MTTLLHVDASCRTTESRTRKLAAEYINNWKRAHSDGSVIYRDVAAHPPAHFTALMFASVFTRDEDRTPDMKQALTESTVLTDELFAADHLLFAVPMYNFSVPSTFKAYIDSIVIPHRTVSYDAGFPQGKLTGKHCTIVTTSGATYAPGTPLASFDHFEPYLRSVLAFIGITDVTFIKAEGLDFSPPPQRDAAYAKAASRLRELAGAATFEDL